MLTPLENFWASLYEGRNPLIVTTLLSFSIHETVYFGRFIPFYILDRIPYFQKYKIQQNKPNTNEQLWKCLRFLMFTHFFVQLPMQLAFHPTAEYFGMQIAQVPFPSIQQIMGEVLLFLVFEDIHHYVFHQLLHHPSIYKQVHKQHHEFSSPFGLTAEYAHPFETFILGTGTIGGPLLYAMVLYYTNSSLKLHIVSVFCWLVVRLLQTVDAHSGYDFPWSLHHFMPFWAGAEFHDHHHQVFLGNYGSSFRFWDWLFGTDKRFEAFKKKKYEVTEEEAYANYSLKPKEQ